MNKNTYDVIIIGAGLAGLSCAVDLVEKDKKVLIVEKQAYLGGRTASWTEDGMPVESALHKFLGFYSELPQLIKRVGVNLDDIIAWEDEMEIIPPDGAPRAVFGASLLGRPLETILTALGNNEFLSIKDKASLVEFLTVGLKDYYTNPEELDQYSVAEYVDKLGITEPTVQRIIRALNEALLFLPIEETSTLALAALFGPYLHKSVKFGIGAFKGGMTEVMIDPIVSYIKKHGGEVKTETTVERLLVENDTVVGIQTDQEELRADTIVLATTAKVAQDLVKEPFAGLDWTKQFLQLPTLSAIGVIIDFDQPMWPVDRVVFAPGTSWPVFAEQSRTTFKQVKGRLSIDMGPGPEMNEKTDEELYETIVTDGERLGIDVKKHYVRHKIIRHTDEFYRPSPGVNKYRPGQETPIPGLVLAGDYTDQPNPSTMEGAVISGQRAANIILQ